MQGSKLIISAILLLFFFNSNAQTIRGNGQTKTEFRELTGFNEIIAQGNFNLILTQGEKEGIKLETDGNILEFFQTRINNNTLYITMIADVKKTKKLDISVSVKELNKIILLNNISLKTTDVIHFNNLSIFSGGGSMVDINIYAEQLDLQITDGTYATIKGYAKKFNLQAHDETELDAFEFQTDFCNATSSGLTDVMIWVEKDLKLLVTGGSNLYYMGNPTVNNRIFSSSGFVVKRKKPTK
jgi:hypothetical protein